MNNSIREAECREDKMTEVYNAITGNFLTENPEPGFNSALGPGRIVKSLYKGLTPAMKQAIYDEQAKQREELKVYFDIIMQGRFRGGVLVENLPGGGIQLLRINVLKWDIFN